MNCSSEHPAHTKLLPCQMNTFENDSRMQISLSFPLSPSPQRENPLPQLNAVGGFQYSQPHAAAITWVHIWSTAASLKGTVPQRRRSLLRHLKKRTKFPGCFRGKLKESSDRNNSMKMHIHTFPKIILVDNSVSVTRLVPRFCPLGTKRTKWAASQCKATSQWYAILKPLGLKCSSALDGIVDLFFYYFIS